MAHTCRVGGGGRREVGLRGEAVVPQAVEYHLAQLPWHHQNVGSAEV
jgi:hypothetical protein